MPGHEAVLTLYRPENDKMSFFNFLQKKVARLDKKGPAQLRWLKLQKSCGKISKSAFYETCLNFDKKNMIGWL